jgi:hypothetical protein
MARLKRGKTLVEDRTHYVENCLDELWIGVKGQSNPEIAGSPRNSFRASLVCLDGGRALNGLGGPTSYQTQQTPNTGT